MFYKNKAISNKLKGIIAIFISIIRNKGYIINNAAVMG